jgi:histidinol-phosphate aminotransferase
MPAKSSKTTGIAKLIRPQIQKLAAYHIDETSVRIKLDAMENPFSLPQPVRREIGAAVRSTAINLYPDPSGKELKKAIASLWSMRPEQMLLGNGSDELIQSIILAFGGPVLIPVPTFAMYDITARALAQDVIAVRLDKGFDLDADLMLKKAEESKAHVIFLACPNNPTGNRFSDAAVQKILDKTGAAVVIDEAYFSFSGKTWLPHLKKYRNMIILRTLSKIGFAGLRVGVLASSREIVDELNKIRLPYNINSLSQAAAVTALRHRNVLESQISLLISEREKLYNAFSQMQGVTAFPSETNFVMIRTAKDASKVHQQLKRAGILVKNLSKPGPLNSCLRITVGTPDENRALLAQLKRILAASKRT